MPRSEAKSAQRPQTVHEVAAEVGVYPIEAYEFVQRGLHFTVTRTHGPAVRGSRGSRHISGQQLCEGLRAFALGEYGMMARAVLGRWNITTTHDFGRIVFALIEGGILQKTPEDTIEDFRAVYEFSSLEACYRIESKL